MKQQKEYSIPILFIIFRRKSTTLKVFRAISQARPKKLYISQDGPRNKIEEKDVMELRKLIIENMNWNCKFIFWTHKTNLGLKKHIPEALTKFFEEEKYGIYLEDDTLPSLDFFYFQKYLLEKYKDDMRIFSINGSNLFAEPSGGQCTYYLSQIGSIWGMGIWKRSWKLYSSNVNNLKDFVPSLYKDFIFSKKYFLYLKFFLNLIKRGKINTWDYQLEYAAVKNRMYFLSPSDNLVENIGINNGGTNLFLQNYNSKLEKVKNNGFHIIPQNDLSYNKEKDLIYFDRFYKYFYIRIILSFVFYSLPYFVQSRIKNTLSISLENS